MDAVPGDAAPAGGGADILIVDDRPDKLLAYRTILEDLGQNIFTAASGEQALKQVLEREFAVILLDVNMPGMNGLETAALIRSRSRSAHIPIIFITADFNDEPHMAKGYALGAVDYIASPVVPEILQAKVRVFVDLFLLAQQAKLQAAERIALAEEKAARAAAEQASRWLTFLAQASAALAASLDSAAIRREVVRLCVPALADASMLTLVAEQGQDACGEVAWVPDDPGRAPVVRSARKGTSPWLDAAVERVLQSGKLEVFSNQAGTPASNRLDESPLFDPADAPFASAIRRVAFVPLQARGRPLGILMLALCAPGREFDTDTLAMATKLAGRAAIALDNALLYRKIQEEDRRKDEFLAMLAHELRNPLAPISNAVHVLQLADQTPARLTWAIDVIGRQLKQLVRLVDDLLDVSRITRGKIELRIETIDAAEVVVAAVETSRPFVDALEHTLTVLLPPERLLLRGDFARVAQVLANLINNAAKYTDRGGRISVAVERQDAEVVFRIRDTGMGIARDQLTAIFEPFTQIDRALDRSQGGLGLGLTLVRRLVEMQEGSVRAQSEGLGHGSEFTVALPAATAARHAGAESRELARLAPLPALDLSVLVVDDNRDVAESTAVLLRMAGCDTHVVYDGDEALRAMARVRPDAVLLDIGLPRMNGYEVAERIRAEPDYERTLIVAVSGYGQEEHRLQSQRSGFDYHIVKPIDPPLLTGLLASLWSHRSAAGPENPASFSARRRGE